MAAAPSAASPAWSTRLLADLDAADQRARQLITGLSLEQLNWSSAPHSWSIGQCIDHLAITTELYLPAIGQALVGQPAAPAQEIKLPWFGRWFINNYIEPSSQTKRANAPTKIVPRSQVELSVLDRFLRGNQEARKLIREAQNYDINRIRFKNPLVPILRFTVGTGLEITTRHERRHLLQAERVRESPGFPK